MKLNGVGSDAALPMVKIKGAGAVDLYRDVDMVSLAIHGVVRV